MKYVFCESNESGVIKVSAESLYGKSGVSGMTDSKFGFVIERNRNNNSSLRIPEINSGFIPAPCFGSSEVTEICQDSGGCFLKAKYDGDYPLSFRIDVHEEGVVFVTLKVFAAEDTDSFMIFSNNRQLVYKGALKKGVSLVKTFPVMICPIIPRNYTESADTTAVTVTVMGKGVRIQSLEMARRSSPVLWIAGDSTVTNQCCEYPYLGGNSYAGWGQMLQFFVGNDYSVSNHAHSGLTLESFRSEGHYDILLNRVSKKDIVLFQFGHNDQKLAHLTADGGYRERYEAYIAEIRRLGGSPVIVTPLARNTWKGDGESYNDLLAAYNDVCFKIGRELDVPVVSLHDAAMAFIVKKGRDGVKKYFFPSDYTHTNDYGAFFFAGIVYSELVRLGVLEEGIRSAFINTEEPAWVAPDKLVMPLLPEALTSQNDAGASGEDPFAGETDLDKVITRAESLGLVIKAMKFFPVNVYNDVFTDVVGHEPYAGTVECAVQNGIIPKSDIDAKLFRPKDNVTGEEFLEFAANGYRSRQPGKVDALPAAEKLRKKDVVLKKEALELLRGLKV